MPPPRASEADARDALSRVLLEDGDRLYRLALRVTRDPDLAADAVQEAFASALQGVGEFRGEAGLGTWLHRIVYTKSIDLLRRRARETPLPEEESSEIGPEDLRLGHGPAWNRPPDDILFDTETRRALEEAVTTLTPLQRAVFELREMEGRSTEEAAEILGLEPGTVRVHLHRARLRLRNRLRPWFRGEAR
jgi:RNA polymerase sigma-70 factor (ECF subfamily)